MSEKNEAYNVSEKELKDIVNENNKNLPYYIDFEKKDTIIKELLNGLSCISLNFNDPRKAEICENIYYVLKSITYKIKYGDYRYIAKELLSLFKFDIVNFSSNESNQKELKKFSTDVCSDTVKLQQTIEIIMAFNKFVDKKTIQDQNAKELGQFFLYRVPYNFLDITSNFSPTTALLGIKKTARNFYRNTKLKEDIHRIYINSIVDEKTKTILDKIVSYDDYLCGMHSSTENNFTSWNRIARNLPSWSGGKKNRKTRKNNNKTRKNKRKVKK
jgi:hypothetical protein